MWTRRRGLLGQEKSREIGKSYRYAAINEIRSSEEKEEFVVRRKKPKTVIEAFELDAEAIFRVWGQHDPSLAPTDVSIGSTYTKLWNHEMWKEHISIKRYLRHLINWPKSTIAKSIVPVTLCVVSWILLVRAIAFRLRLELETPFTCAILFGQAITLLLTLRTNQSLARVQEARTVWGKVVTTTRETAALAASYLKPTDPNLATAMARYLTAYGFALKRHLRGTLDQQLVYQVYTILLPHSELELIDQAPRPYLFFLKRARQCLARAVQLSLIERTVHRSIEIKLGALNDLAGACERIILSPSPTAYTRHTSRVLLIFLLLIPIGLQSLKLGAFMHIFMGFFVAYLLVGIEQIGVELEEPFRWLPLQELTLQLLQDVVHEFSNAFSELPSSFCKEPDPTGLFLSSSDTTFSAPSPSSTFKAIPTLDDSIASTAPLPPHSSSSSSLSAVEDDASSSTHTTHNNEEQHQPSDGHYHTSSSAV